MKYNPKLPEHRALLAYELCEMLKECGFEEGAISGGEKTYFREIKNGMRVVVYTSIHGTSVAHRGNDAIRVAGLYVFKDGKTKGIVRNRRVNRTGLVSDILDRTKERMRDTWKSCLDRKACTKCGSPTFLSRKGNDVCVEICWDKK